MKNHILKAIAASRDGKALTKLSLGIGLLALGGAMSSPEFEAVPYAGKVVAKLRNHLPDNLQKVTNAMSGT